MERDQFGLKLLNAPSMRKNSSDLAQNRGEHPGVKSNNNVPEDSLPICIMINDLCVMYRMYYLQ